MGGRSRSRSRARSHPSSHSPDKFSEYELRLQRIEKALYRSRSRERKWRKKAHRREKDQSSNRSIRDVSRSHSISPVENNDSKNRPRSRTPSESYKSSFFDHDDSRSIERSPNRDPARHLEVSRVCQEENDVIVLNDNTDLNLNFLGIDPVENAPKRAEFELPLVLRWSYITGNGLEKTEKEELLKKYPTPTNFESLQTPELNNEIQQLASANTIKRDRYQVLAQNQLASAIKALGTAVNQIIKDKNEYAKTVLWPSLTDCGKIINDSFYTISQSRRYLILPQITDKALKQVMLSSKPDTKLFGSDLGERYKAAKEMEKAKKVLKSSNTIKKLPVAGESSNLNYQGPSRSWGEVKHQGRSPSHKFALPSIRG